MKLHYAHPTKPSACGKRVTFYGSVPVTTALKDVTCQQCLYVERTLNGKFSRNGRKLVKDC